MKKNKVIIVDDHHLFAVALSDLINTFDDFEVMTCCKNGIELQNKLKTFPQMPDIILMDVSMPLLNGKEATKWLKEYFPDIRVLALSMNNDEKDIIAMLKNGAKGYILKDIDPPTLEGAMVSVVNSGFYNNDLSATAMISILNGETSNKNTIKLKEREMEFLTFACSEMTYKEIALKMCLSPKTIDGYRESLFHKLGAKSRIGLVMYAIRNNYVQI